MILTNQEAMALKADSQKDFALAKVAGVHADGLSLIFTGEDAPTQKHYLCAGGCVFKAGQRVLAVRVSGEYVAVCTVGTPETEIVANRAIVANRVQSNDVNDDYILLSANPSTKQYHAWSKTLGWKQLS